MDEKPKIKSPYEPMENHKDDNDDAKKPFESQYPHWDRILREVNNHRPKGYHATHEMFIMKMSVFPTVSA